MIYLRLFFEFFKTGLFSVGGGMATLPFLYSMSEKTGWFTAEQLADMVAVSESTPGPIGVNMATYVGYTTAGIPGALAATLGLACPCVIVILLIAGALEKFRKSPVVEGIFSALRPCSVALIASAGLLLAKVTFVGENGLKPAALIMGGALFVLTRYVPKLKGVHPIVFIGISAIAGCAML